MKIGVGYPQYKTAMADPGEIRAYAQGAEALGYDYIMSSEHVIRVQLSSDHYWEGPEPVYEDPFTLIPFMAAVTSKIGFSTSVVILPQRQTVLLAKQAACVDMLSNGRLRLGVGTGWNKVEYEALNVKFEDRGAIFEDQIDILRALWTKPNVTHKTRYHTITDIGLDVMPVQRPIPLWMGGGNAGTPTLDKVLRRIARIGDGWTANLNFEAEGLARIAKLRAYCKEYGRNPSDVGIEGFVVADPKKQDAWADSMKAWQAAGVSHVGISTTFGPVKGVDAHLRILEDFRKAIPKDLLAK